MIEKCGNFKVSYEQDMEIFRTTFSKACFYAFLAFLAIFPFFVNDYIVYVANLIGITLIGTIGLNLLTGYAGQISLGHGAFMGVGAYAAAILANRFGLPFFITIPIGGFVAALIGMIFGIPSLRLKGFYLAIATLAAQVIIEFAIVHWKSLTNGTDGMMVPFASIKGFAFDTDKKFYFLLLPIVVFMTAFAKNITRTRVGRAFIAIRDRYISAEVMGVNLFVYKLKAFFIGSLYAGIAGALWAYYVTVITPEHFTLSVSIQYLAMIIIGGLGSILGSIFGTVFLVVLPEVLRNIASILGSSHPQIINAFAAVREGVFGLVIVLFLIFEPDGLVHRWELVKAYFKLWPFSY